MIVQVPKEELKRPLLATLVVLAFAFLGLQIYAVAQTETTTTTTATGGLVNASSNLLSQISEGIAVAIAIGTAILGLIKAFEAKTGIKVIDEKRYASIMATLQNMHSSDEWIAEIALIAKKNEAKIEALYQAGKSIGLTREQGEMFDKALKAAEDKIANEVLPEVTKDVDGLKVIYDNLKSSVIPPKA